jgi:hypothetical protein
MSLLKAHGLSAIACMFTRLIGNIEHKLQTCPTTRAIALNPLK